ncbi:MAG: class I SAM-dependent methyltransferase [Pirellulaceae bacterium]
MNSSRNPFDDAAAEYDEWFDSERGRDVFAQEVACLQKLKTSATGRWLEIGIGSGRFAAALGVKEGVDPSASMLALAARRGIQTVKAVGESLPYESRCFDGVLMTTTLCFLADPERTLRECHRVLKDAGQLVVSFIPADSLWGQSYARKATEGHPIYSAATFYTCDEVASFAARAGFELKGACSCLLAPPDSLDIVAPTRQGIVKDAGFVAMAFDKSRPREQPTRTIA